MRDILQLKRGPSSNLERAKLRQGEPAYLYDTKTFVVGTGETHDPVLFLNEAQVIALLDDYKTNTDETLKTHGLNITVLSASDNEHQKRLVLLESHKTNTDETLKTHGLNITALSASDNEQREQLLLLEDKSNQKIKSSQLSTATDNEKIGLVHLKQEIIAYINQNSGASGGEGSVPQIIPGSIGFDLLATEVVTYMNNGDYGDY